MKRYASTIMIVFLVIIVIFQFFNISLTSLPTDFYNVVTKYSEKYEDGSPIKEIRIGDPYIEDAIVVLEDAKAINMLLNLGVKVYDGGRLPDRGEEIEMTIYFENGVSHRYLVAEQYISSRITPTRTDLPIKDYKVMDDNNKIYNQLDLIYNKNK